MQLLNFGYQTCILYRGLLNLFLANILLQLGHKRIKEMEA